MMSTVKKYKWVIAAAVMLAVCLTGSIIKRNHENKLSELDGILPVNLEATEFESDSAKEEYIVKININTADADELCELPHIGSTVAKRIIAFRNEAGGFKNTYELMLVKGIGEKTFEKISKYITVE